MRGASRRRGRREQREIRGIFSWTCVFVVLTAFSSAASRAEDWPSPGSRHRSLDATSLFDTPDRDATRWNPAAYGFAEEVDIRLSLGAGRLLGGDDGRNFQTVASQLDDLAASLDRAKRGQAFSVHELQELMDLTRRGAARHDSRGFAIETNLGFSSRYTSDPAQAPHSGEALSDNPFEAVGRGSDRSSELSSGGLAAVTADQASEHHAEQGGIDVADPKLAAAVESLARTTDAEPTLTDRESGARVENLTTFEVGVSYGHAFDLPVLPGWVSFGATAKAITGLTDQTTLDGKQLDPFEEGMKELLSGTQADVTTVRFGLDLGFIAKPTHWATFGVVARNINSPKFGRYGGKKIKLAREAWASLSLEPLPRWIISADVDLTENESSYLTGLRSRQVQVTTEYRFPIGPVNLAARTGIRTNIARRVDDPIAWTTGLGISYRQLYLDATAGAGFDDVTVNRRKLPERETLAISLEWRGTF